MLTVPLLWPSIETLARPWSGPVSVYHLSELPVNRKTPRAPFRCSVAYELPYAEELVRCARAGNQSRQAEATT